MTNFPKAYKLLKDAIDNNLVVQAVVSLYDGQTRVRVGPVANLNLTHVTILDAKGFRTTPLSLVHSITVVGKLVQQ